LKGDESEFGLCALAMIYNERQLTKLRGYSNRPEATQLLAHAIEMYNSPFAMCWLGEIAKMKGDARTASDYYHRAAALGHPDAQYKLARLYWNGLRGGVKVDRKKAVEMATRAAERRYPDALAFLGDALIRGKGMRKSHAKALKYFKKSSNQYGANGYNKLGLFFMGGEWSFGVNYEQAFKYFKLGADLPSGFYRSQIRVAELYENGMGTPKDLVMAMRYYKLAEATAKDTNEEDAAKAAERCNWLLENPDCQRQLLFV
jgi:TPR repeat protein